jgi:uncharacterized lipoprotein YajG
VRKYLLSTILLLLSSCYYLLPQEVKINPEFFADNVKISTYNKVRVNVYDKRPDRTLLGKRTMSFGGEITNRQNVQIMIGTKIMEELGERGFKFGQDRVMDVFLLSLDYKVESELWKIRSFTNCVITVMVKGFDDVLIYRNYYKGNAGTTRYLLSPRASTNEKDINAALRMAMESIFEDENLTMALAR